MIRIMLVFGTRPAAIKMATVVQELIHDKDFATTVCVTAQHREMLDQVLDIFNILPDYDLDIMQSQQTLVSLTSKVMQGINDVIDKVQPDMILVHGDTTTSFAAALAAFYRNIPVGHVEAGLRSHNPMSPFPEEMNRNLTSKIASLHFAPTFGNKYNLQKENIKDNIFVTGNTVIDALMQMIQRDYIFKSPILNKLCKNTANGKRLILMTAHRRENWGEPLVNICNAVKRAVEENEDVEVIYPVHMNPIVRDYVYPILSPVDRVHLVEPLDVQDMHNLLDRCYMVITDSGGLQEEAPALGKPVIVLREETERPEIFEKGMAILSGTKEESVYEKIILLLENRKTYLNMKNSVNPFGDGKASKRIVHAIKHWTGVSKTRPSDFKIIMESAITK